MIWKSWCHKIIYVSTVLQILFFAINWLCIYLCILRFFSDLHKKITDFFKFWYRFTSSCTFADGIHRDSSVRNITCGVISDFLEVFSSTQKKKAILRAKFLPDKERITSSRFSALIPVVTDDTNSTKHGSNSTTQPELFRNLYTSSTKATQLPQHSHKPSFFLSCNKRFKHLKTNTYT